MNLRDEKTNILIRRNFEGDKKLLETEAFWVTIAEELMTLNNIINRPTPK